MPISYRELDLVSQSLSLDTESPERRVHLHEHILAFNAGFLFDHEPLLQQGLFEFDSVTLQLLLVYDLGVLGC